MRIKSCNSLVFYLKPPKRIDDSVDIENYEMMNLAYLTYSDIWTLYTSDGPTDGQNLSYTACGLKYVLVLWTTFNLII